MTESARLACVELGTGRALVLVHGHPFDRSVWKPQFELADEFHVVALDLPGFGGSPVRRDPMTMRGFAEATIELMDLLDIESAVIAGLSMGGLVAMELGLGYPERVDGLVLAATTAEPVSDGEVQQRYAKAALLQERGMLPLAGEMISDLFGPRASRDPALVVHIVTMMLCAPPDGAAAALRGGAARPDYSTLLRGLSVPSLVIAGDHDAHASAAVVRQLQRAPGGRTRAICRFGAHAQSRRARALQLRPARLRSEAHRDG